MGMLETGDVLSDQKCQRIQGQIVKSYLLMRRLSHRVVYNISTAGGHCTDYCHNFAARVAHDFIFKICFQTRPRSFTLHSLVARQQELPCDLSKKEPDIKESIIYT